MNTKEVKEIMSAAKDKSVKPIYFLMGEEPYFIDQISNYFENNFLGEEQKGFDQQVLYGMDTDVEQVTELAKRFPMTGEHQLIIVKEAQAWSRTIGKLLDYAKNPQPSTVLMIGYKYKKIDKRKTLYKTLKKNGVVYESKKVYENQVPGWIQMRVKDLKHSIEPKGVKMLAEFLGADLGKIDKELEKLSLVIPENTEITPQLIEKNIGISKDFNNFELQNAIGARDQIKAYRIANYFGQNPKDNPIMMTTAILYSFFSKVLQYHALKDKSRKNVASTLGISPFFVKDYASAARNIPMKKASRSLSYLRKTDIKSKGVGSSNVPQGDLLKELLVKIMN